jgi:MraZ protein
MTLSELMGHSPAKVDEKGRIKVPNDFRQIISDRWGTDCFITSIDGNNALIYPLLVWREFQERLSRVPSTSMAKKKLQERVNYFGHLASIDAQGRLLVPTILRSIAKVSGDVVVLGQGDHLEVWSGDTIGRRIEEAPMTADDFKELELHGV